MNRREKRAKAAVERSLAKATSAPMPRFTRSPKQEFKRILRKGGKGKK
jgi:hypothetical protein